MSSKWGEIWGVSAMGPYRPKSEFTKRWKEQLFTELDKRTKELKTYRIKNVNLKKDCLEWASLLRDIILPLSRELSKKMKYFIDTKDWQFITDKEILTNKNIPPIENNILLLNNSLYPGWIKQATIPQIKANKNVLLFKLINFALDMPNEIPKEILPGIHKILYINLDHRKDRNERIINEFNKIGIDRDSLERISAVYTPENGAIGCFHSHIKALQLAMKKYPSQNILICEDDIVFTQNRQKIINMLQTFFMDPIIKVKWDVLMLAHNTNKSESTNIKGVIKLIDSQTSSAYLINGKYSSIINNIFGITNSVFTESKKWLPEFCNDQCWKNLQKTDNWYGFEKPFIKQGESYSDIEKKIVSYEKFENTSNNGIFDFVEIGTSDFDTEVEKANDETIVLHKNSLQCSWVLPTKQLQTQNLETNPEKIWGRQMLLDVVKQSGIPYRLAYGTILGSLRHNGFIDNDGDADVMVLANKKNKLWTLDTLGIHDQSYKRLRARIARVLLSTSVRLYPTYIIDVHIGSYRGKAPLDDSGDILGHDEINWGIEGYICTLTIWDKERKKHLNYPHVLDIDLVDESDITKQYGSECQCSLYDSTYSCFEGVHKYCMKYYGSSYMTPISATTNKDNKRVYKGGDGDNSQEKEGKNLQKRCKNEPFSEDLENLVKGKYGHSN